MPAPTLRPYQLEAVEAVRQAFGQRHRRVLFVMPTGAGKTTVFTYITDNAAAKGNRVLILVHRVELLDQASESLSAMGVRHGLIASGRSMNLAAPVQVASVQTVARRLAKLPRDLFQLLIVDEAHHATAGTWSQVIGHFSGARVLGVTATPCRGDGRGLGEQFDDMILGPTSAWLTEQGFLAPARVFAPPIGFDAKGLRKRMGDFDMKQASEELAGRAQLGDAVSHYQRHLSSQTAIAFCCSVAHAEAVAASFRSRSVTAASIDGSMDALQRRQLLAELGAGRLKVLTSCSLIGEGVDVPSVAGCILLRPTQSLSLHLQMIGRALRPQEGKTAVVLDHVGNVQRLGHHLEEQDWTLDGVKKKPRAAGLSVKVCPKCFAAISSQAPKCSECGHQFAAEKRQEIKVIDGELNELRQGQPVGGFRVGDVVKLIDFGPRSKGDGLDKVHFTVRSILESGKRLEIVWPETGHVTTPEAKNFELVSRPNPVKERRREQGSAQTLEELIQVGQRRGMANPRGWARHVLAARQAKGHFERERVTA